MFSLFPTSEISSVVHGTRGWERFKNTRLLVTGGTGFFGLWLLECLAEADREYSLNLKIFVSSRNPRRVEYLAPHLFNNPIFEFIAADVRELMAPRESCEWVIHAATDASADLNERNPSEMASVVVNGTINCLKIAKSMGSRMLFVSSGAVYGTLPSGMLRVPESHIGSINPLAIGGAYAEAKRLGEHLCFMEAQNNNLNVVIARCFAFVGPGLPLDKHFAIGNFIRDALNDQDIVVKGNGLPVRSYLYASDLTIWLLRILTEGRCKAAYNVGSMETISIAELAGMVNSTIGGKGSVIVEGKAAIGGAANYYVPDTSRAQKELGLSECVALRNAIRQTADWHRSRQELIL